MLDPHPVATDPVEGWEKCLATGRHAFGNVWNAIYGAKGLGWNDNPWVWRCEFEVIEGGR
jgi:hypothetical protein